MDAAKDVDERRRRRSAGCLRAAGSGQGGAGDGFAGSAPDPIWLAQATDLHLTAQDIRNQRRQTFGLRLNLACGRAKDAQGRQALGQPVVGSR